MVNQHNEKILRKSFSTIDDDNSQTEDHEQSQENEDSPLAPLQASSAAN